MHNGAISGYQVKGGTLSIQGKGLNSGDADYTDLIARSVQVNAGIWANDLKVTAGRNQVNAANTRATRLAGSDDESPAVAIDVASLGGMYAGKIMLVGTEGGVGVRNAGKIGASAGDVVISADGKLLNSGSISSAGATRVATSGDIDNHGTLYAKGDVRLSSGGDLNNRGTVASQANVTLKSSAAEGRIHSSEGAALAAGLDEKGKLGTRGNLTLSAATVQSQGEQLAGGTVQVTAGKVDLSHSRTVASNLTLTASAGDIDLSGARVDASQTLTASTRQTLRSDAAKVVAGTLQLRAGNLSNVAGELAQSGTGSTSIEVDGQLDNQAGRIATNASDAQLSAGSVENAKGRVEHAGKGTLSLSTPLLNGTQGTLVSNGTLQVNAGQAVLDDSVAQGQDVVISADTLSNRGGKVLATQGGNLTLSSQGLLDNTGGTLAASGNSVLTAATLDNSGGTVSAGGTLYAGAGTLLNSAGTFASIAQMTLDAAHLNNNGGTLGSVQSGLLLSARDSTLSNVGGRLEAGGDITLSGQGIDNSAGVISGLSLSLNSHGQLLQNAQGTLDARTTLDLRSGRLENAGGLIQSQGTLFIDTGDQALVNLDDGSGKGIISQAALQIHSAHLDNRGGFLSAKGALQLLGAELSNGNGRIVGAGTVRVQGDHLDNRGGQIQALGNLDVVSTERVDNQGGLIRSGGLLQVHTVTLDNSATQGDNQGLQGHSMRLNADVLGNQAGSVRADTQLDIGVSQVLDNRGGLISSSQHLRLADREPGAQRQHISNLDGRLLAGQSLSMNAAYYSGNGQAVSLGDLTLRLRDGLELSGVLHANASLDVSTAGALVNHGKLLAGKSMLISATTVDNRAAGEISAEQVRIDASERLTNRGLIDGQQVRLRAGSLYNLGSGRIYGDQLGIAAGTLNNANEGEQSAVIAARGRLDIGAEVIDNSEAALIFSAGNLAIGGALDDDGRATGRATLLTNASATIESLGHMALDVQTLRNLNNHFTTREVEISRQHFQEFQLSGSPNRYQASQVSFRHNEVQYLITPEGQRDNWNRYDVTRVVRETQIATSAPGQILAGGNLTINADEVLNDKSQIIAGGLLQGAIGHLTNTEFKGQQVTADSGSVTNFYRIQRKGRDRQGSRVAGYVPAPLIQEITLQPTVWQELAAITGSGTQLDGHASPLSDQQVAGAQAVDTLAGNGYRVAPIIEVNAQTTLNTQGVAEQIRTGGPSLRLPGNSLFSSNPRALRNYLVETDPRFAGYRNWLSSDYMLQRLQLDPALTQQRLGDGFYEQKLIREQIAQLTGRRFIDGYASDEEQYRALLDNAVTVASAWQLVPGVALSAEQMAQLTSDIVWLVEKQVTLAGGETRKVLVPQVYVRVQQGDLNGAGALMAGQQLKLDVVNNLSNSGSLGGGSILALTAQNLDNLGGRIQADKVSLQARDNLNNLGGLIGAVDSLSVSAGHDLNVVSSTHDSSSAQGTRTNLSRMAGLFVSGTGGMLKATAGNDLNLVGAQVVNAGANGSTQLVAGNDLNLRTVTEAQTQSITWDSSNWRKDASRSDVGSSVQGAGDVSLSAGQDVNLRAATVSSTQGGVLLEARRDINLSAGQDYRFADEAHKSKGGNGMFSSKTTTTRDTLSETRAQGSTVSAEQAYLQAGRDVTLRASNVVSTEKTVVLADHDIHIEAGTDTQSERHDKSVKKSGLFSGGGIAVTIGTQQQRVEDLTTSTTAVASTVGSTHGDVVIAAGKDYRQVGSHVMAPKGDIDISAERIDILEARNLVQREHETLFKQTGLSITITNPVLTAIQTAQQMKSASDKTEDGRMKALAGATTALAANNAATAVAQSPGAMGGVNISLSIGAQKSQSESRQSADTSASSTVAAGGNVSLVASGAGADSDITVRGSQIKAGNNALLDAEGDIHLLAATNKATQQSDSRGSSASVGIGFAFGGAQNGFTLNLGVAGNRGEADGEDITHTNTRVEAGNLLLLRSAGDTTLKGAVASGKQVVADIGGDLNIESLQDTSTYTVDEKSMSAGVSLCIPPFCWGVSTAGGSLGAGVTDIDSKYASVTEQSGIKAGDGGFDIRVGGNTDLVGAVISSSDKAVQEGRNQLVTATLTSRDIKNEAEYEGSSVSLGGGYGSAVGKDPNGTVQAGSTQTPGSTLPNEGGFSATLPVALGARDSASSVTRSGISGGLIRVTDDAGQQALTGHSAEMTLASLNRDVSSDRDTSNALKPIFNEQELRAGFEIAGAFTREVGTYLDNKAKESTSAKRLLDEERQKPVDQQDPARMQALAQTLKDNQTWEFGGTSRAVLMALTAAAGGNISGSGASLLQATAVNYMQGLAAQEIKLIADKLDSDVARTALHTLAGCAGAAAQNASCGSGALGAASSVVINNLVEQISGEEGAALTPEEKEARKNLVSSLITGITVASGGDAAIANTAAQIEAENNAFWIPVIMGGAWLIDKGMTAYEAWQDIKALEAGTTTLEELAIAKGEDYIMQVVAGNMGKYGMKAVKKAGGWVAEKVGHHSDDVVITAPSPLDPGKLAPRADGLPVERVQAGSKGNWDKTVNGDLKPKTAYELNNGHTYVTDASGRVNSVEGQLSLTTMDRNPYQQCKVGHCGNAGDDGGHLIASSLGGAGDKINMVPQAAKLNRGDWKRMENEMRTALQSGQTVSVKIDIGYPPTGGVRPNEFTVLATIDGRVVPYRFTQ
nr:hemagglutinin repeat-containing protein [Pseudomonas brassicae]